MVGKEILGYHVDEKIGSGGFGTVYKVSKTNAAGTYVRALKHITLPTKKQYASVLNSMGGDYAKADDYFAGALNDIVNEIKILSMLSESGVTNIVRYYENDIIETPSPKTYDIYILMEYLTPFTDYVDSRDFAVKDAIKLGKDILKALVSCHDQNIIHRDIKDDNIFVSSDGTYKLGDFGVSKALKDKSRAESVKGTPNFIAPEVYLGKEKYDNTVDIYSLGIVLYKILNKMRNPFLPMFPAPYNTTDEDAAFEARMKGMTPELPISAQNELGQTILKAIMPRDQRYDSAREFLSDLEDVEARMTDDELNVVVCQATADFEIVREKRNSVLTKNNSADETIGAVYASDDDYQVVSEDRHLFDTMSVDYKPPVVTEETSTDNKYFFESSAYSEPPKDTRYNYAPKDEFKETNRPTQPRSNPNSPKKLLIVYIIAWAVCLVAFNVIAFVIPTMFEFENKFDGTFWAAYGYTTAAFLGQLACALIVLREKNDKKFVYSVSQMVISYGAVAAMLIVGGACMIIPSVPVWVTIVACTVILVVNVVAVLKANVAADIIVATDEKIQTQTFFINSITVDAQNIMELAKTPELRVEAKNVYEAIRYSDPMSNPMLADIDSKIAASLDNFEKAVVAQDLELSKGLGKDIVLLVKNRNQKCKILK